MGKQKAQWEGEPLSFQTHLPLHCTRPFRLVRGARTDCLPSCATGRHFIVFSIDVIITEATEASVRESARASANSTSSVSSVFSAAAPRRRRRQRAASPSLDPFAAGLQNRNTFRFGTPSHHTGLVEAPPSRPPAREFDWSRYTMVHQQPKSDGQARYHANLANADINIVICMGPAGCGKTLLAVQQGLNELKAGLVKKMIISRPGPCR